MPISNPIIQGLQVTIYQGADIITDNADPVSAPLTTKKLWFNTQSRKLFLSTATNSVADWVAIGGDTIGAIDWEAIANKPNTFPSDWEMIANKPNTFPVDVASILNKILVENGEVLTTDDNVIFED